MSFFLKNKNITYAEKKIKDLENVIEKALYVAKTTGRNKYIINRN